ncbi:MAG: hypothetical protein ACRDTQ_04215 [Micromonosporaceae bacterium]
MSRSDDASAALEDRDWSSATVDHKPRGATVVQSVRMSRDLLDRLYGEADSRGVTPSELIRDLVEVGLSELDEDTTITMRLSDLRRAISKVAHSAA